MSKIVCGLFLYLFALLMVLMCVPILLFCIIVAPRASAAGLAGFGTRFAEHLGMAKNE